MSRAAESVRCCWIPCCRPSTVKTWWPWRWSVPVAWLISRRDGTMGGKAQRWWNQTQLLKVAGNCKIPSRMGIGWKFVDGTLRGIYIYIHTYSNGTNTVTWVPEFTAWSSEIAPWPGGAPLGGLLPAASSALRACWWVFHCLRGAAGAVSWACRSDQRKFRKSGAAG